MRARARAFSATSKELEFCFSIDSPSFPVSMVLETACHNPAVSIDLTITPTEHAHLHKGQSSMATLAGGSALALRKPLEISDLHCPLSRSYPL